ncbi:hypothetical protein AVEN_39379-1 [Araneus ventricosus]|uniref:Terpene utilization protein AtuA n=1 Tax=Araneus ventricosus TaxID=182803 RepID=A0A4Y2M247_ARAVE|nr:hypothetical protein AVEN_191444-1 [Araneus ventricosus]GBN20865.1 hypothetical protein AVEN_39379-1 [Araneus ventricosus]
MKYLPKRQFTNFLKCRIFGHSSQFRMSSNIRIGCASGFWGDTAMSVPALVHGGKLDFLVFDYLSEITMSLLAKAKEKNPDLGYTPDFVHSAMAPNLQAIKEKNIRVVANAGGINPHSCADALRAVAKKLNIDLKVAVVTGDDLLPRLENVRNLNIKDMDKGTSLPSNVHSMNAYLGAGPIAKAIDYGADVVITGRCVDSAVVLGPLVSKFKWSFQDLDKLAMGSLAGHLLECGAQSAGGIHTDWHLIKDWHNMGFPIAECKENGEFTISKPPNTGGIVTVGTVSEQLVYEIGDPANYALPDVLCDFTNVKLTQVAENVVLVQGAKGKRPSDYYKVSATYGDGYRATAVSPVVGPKAAEKALITAKSIIQRSENVFKRFGLDGFRRTHLEVLGAEQNYGKNAKAKDTREVVMWIAVHHDKKEAISLFSREIAAASTGGAPGFTTLIGGRPKASPILKLFSFLYPKDKIQIQVTYDGKTEMFKPEVVKESSTTPTPEPKKSPLIKGTNTYRLGDLAYTRSGDKGDTCNVGVIARHPAFLPYIEDQLTEASVANYFDHLFSSDKRVVERYSLPGIHALNFVMREALGGGGVASLRSDPQGKACGQMLTDFELRNMPNIDTLKK